MSSRSLVVSLIVEKAIKVSSQVRIASVKGSVNRDGLDHYYHIYSADSGRVKIPNMQTDRTDRIHGIFKRR